MSDDKRETYFQYCPHCGTTREGLSDDQTCWRCGRLPIDSGDEPATEPASTKTQSPPDLPKSQRHYYGFRLVVIWSMIGIVILAAILAIILADNEPSDVTGDRTIEVTATTRPSLSPSHEASIEPGPVTNGGITATGGIVQATLPPSPIVLIGDDAATFAAQRTVTLSPPTPTYTPLPTSTPAPTLTPDIGLVECPGAPETRLAIDTRIETLTGLNLRSAPSAEGPIVEELSGGLQLTVVGGPQCSGEVLWWLVRVDNGTVGWIAEGNLDAYFVAPLP